MRRRSGLHRIGLIGWLSSAVLALPALARAAAPPVEAYGRLPAVEHVNLSPSGQSFALITVDGDKRALIVASAGDNKPFYALNVSGLKVRRVDWAGEDHLLVTLSSTVQLEPDFTTSQAELEGVLAINVRTRKVISVFKDQSQIGHMVDG